MFSRHFMLNILNEGDHGIIYKAGLFIISQGENNIHNSHYCNAIVASHF